MGFLKKYIKKYYIPFIIALMFLSVEAVCDLMQPTIMSHIVDIGVAKKQLNYVISMTEMMLMVTCIGAIGATGRNILSSYVSQHFAKDLRFDMYKNIQEFSFENIDKFEGASLVTRLTNDVTQIQNFVNGTMRIFAKAPILCVGSIIMASRLNPHLSIIILIVLPIIVIMIYLNMRIGLPFFNKVQAALDRVNGVMREYLSGVRVVKAFNRFDFERDRFNAANMGLGSITTSAMRVMAIFSPGITLTVNLGIVAVIWIGGYRVNAGKMHVGQIIAFINYMSQILFSLMIMSNVISMFVRGKTSANRIGQVFNEKSNIKLAEKPMKTEETGGSIEFQSVSFNYGEQTDAPVLNKINFKCPRGETLGIIGSTGSGKSTLVNLIPRFYDIKAGVIKFNGLNIKDMDINELREKIAIVPQKTVLFSGTIAENIMWGKENASEEELSASAVISNSYEFINKFPEGFNTLLGQSGVNLSGGQKQRLSIARAIIRKPELLILDDCTSAVDIATEFNIREGLKKYSEGLTTLIVAQRITSVLNADKILVLDDGNIAGIGTHTELMEKCTIYKDIYRSQIGSEGAEMYEAR